jgi:hypothetical protein
LVIQSRRKDDWDIGFPLGFAINAIRPSRFGRRL